MDSELYTWSHLGTFAGATAATLLIVQYLKLPIDQIHHIPTRYVTLAVSLVIQLCVWLLGGGKVAFSDLPLLILNAFMVALSAMGAYEHTFKKGDTA